MKKNILLHIFRITLIIVISILLFTCAIVRYDNEDSNNTYFIEGTLKNVKYERYMGAKLLFFTLDDTDYYCSGSIKDLQRIIELSKEETVFEMRVTYEKTLNPIFLFEYPNVIDIRTKNEVIISLETHNEDETISRCIFIVLSIIHIIIGIIYILVLWIFYMSKPLPNRKKHQKIKST